MIFYFISFSFLITTSKSSVSSLSFKYSLTKSSKKYNILSLLFLITCFCISVIGIWFWKFPVGITFLLAKLIKNYHKTKILDKEGNIHKVRIILFAPTAFPESNKIYDTLNVDPNDIHINYSDDQLLNVLDEIKQENDEIKEHKK